MVREIARAGGRHVELPLASKNPFTIRANIGRLAAVIEAQAVDIVHVRSRAPAWSAYYAAQRTGRHFVTTFHSPYGSGSVLKRYYNSVMARGERVIAISQFVAEHASAIYGVPAQSLRLIPRGVELARFDPERVNPERLFTLARQWRLRDGAPVVMLPGRLTRWKGQLVLIEAMAQLGRPEVHCVILGNGKAGYRREIDAAIARHGSSAAFRVIDDCTDMPAAYMLADIVVSASTKPEGFGRVIVEAQAMGRPVIATAHGGAQETVIPGETGWLVPPGNPSALAAVLRQALSQTPAERQALADRAMAHVRANYSSALMAQRTLEVYEELLYARLTDAAAVAAA
jgi:glycosyltransferase involved in cell wall biosynthesis